MKRSFRLNMIGMRVLIAVIILIGSVIPGISDVQLVKAGNQFLWWTEDGEIFITFAGINDSIVIDSGSLDYTRGCNNYSGGIDDVLSPVSDVYIMLSGSVSSGSYLRDISENGLPNTVVGSTGGAFVGETIGRVKPIGYIGPGTYLVVYDECQDGVFDQAIDFLLDPAFEVTLPADIPHLPDTSDIKYTAATRAGYWSNVEMAGNANTELTIWLKEYVGREYNDPRYDFRRPFNYAMKAFLQTIDFRARSSERFSKVQLLNVVTHWQGIFADPPDSDFQRLSPLIPYEIIDTQSGDEVVRRMAQVTSEAGEESALAEALLRSLERYQGAAQANDGTWALTHARAIQRYAALLAEQVMDSGLALADAGAALTADTRTLDQAALDLMAFRDRVATSGFNADELRYASNLGLSASQLADIRATLTALDFINFSKAGMLADLSALQNSSPDDAANLQALSATMDPIIAALEADPGVSLLSPVANAGGPYSGFAGTPIQLDGQASTSTYPITSYDWDLDGDSVFDDSAGHMPEYVFNQSFTGWAGLRVTNLAGLSDIAYTSATIMNNNQSPWITAFSPQDLSPTVIVGAPLTLQVEASDPDNDNITIIWQVDGTEVGSDSAFTYDPIVDDVGMHFIQAVAKDSNPLSKSVIQEWTIIVVLSDGDGDLWNANVDCDDANPLVNPGTAEVLGNGVDDDCNSATADQGSIPRALFNPVPQSGEYNAARWEYGATIDSVYNSTPEFHHQWLTLIDDKDLYRGNVAYTTSSRWVKILLAGGLTYLIDRIKITGDPGYVSVRNFEVAVSTTTADDAAFTTVLTASAQQTGQPQEFILPEPVLAKYIRYRTIDNQWGQADPIYTNRLQVMTGQTTASQTVTFQDLSSDPDSDITSWAWDFGDGATSNEPSPTHTYAEPGVYPVTLTVTDAWGNVSTFSVDQTILNTTDADGPALGMPDSTGTDFWLAFMNNGSSYPSAQDYLHLYISGDTATTGRVTIPGLFYATEFQVTPGQITTVLLPKALRLKGEHLVNGHMEDLSIHVRAGAEVTVYGINRMHMSTDAFTVLPTDALGTDYLVLAYINGYTGYRGNGSEYAVVATEDNTTVTITSTAFSANDQVRPGDTYTMILNRGQAYQFFGGNTWAYGNDVTGTWIRSDKPVAVFGGHSCAFVPHNVEYCDHLVEQMPPVSTWGKEFITVPLATRLLGDTFRILASENNTNIQINGVPSGVLNRGQYSEMILTQASHITADKPILVAQYSNGGSYDGVVSDPFMMLIPPYEQFLTRYTVMTPSSGFRANYINLVVPEAGVGATTLDGTALPVDSFAPVPGSGFFSAQLLVQTGAHVLESTFPFGVFMYGYDQDDSYGYPGGSSLAKIGLVTSLSLQPETADQDVDSQFCTTAAVLDNNNQPLAGVRVDFTVSGANNQSSSAITEVDGTVQYCYTSPVAGQDSITARMGTLQATAQVNWLEVMHNQAPLANAGADQQVNEGAVVTLDGSNSSDPDGDPLTYAWDLNNDGAFDDAAGAQASTTFQDNGIFPITLQTSDPGGLRAVDLMMVTVDNVAPVIVNLAGPLDPQATGSEINLIADFIDPGSADTHTAIWTWHDGTTSSGIVSGSMVQGTHTYTSAGTYVVSLTVTDDDGGIGSDSKTIIVINVPPSVSVSNNGPIDEGSSTLITANASSAAGIIESFSYEFDCDNNSIYEVGPQSDNFTSCTFDDDGSFTVSVRVDDGNGGVATASTEVIVNNVSPVVSATPTNQSLQYSDGIRKVTFTVNDVAADALNFSTSWSSNGVNFTQGLPGNLTLKDLGCTVDGYTHACSWTLDGAFNLAAGTYTIRAAVMDDDGASNSAETTLVVPREDAMVTFDGDNPVAVQVATPGGVSGSFALVMDVKEAYPDGGHIPYAGEISNTGLSLTLVPVGPGSSTTVTCIAISTVGTGYDALHTFRCTFSGITVNTYTVQADVTGTYYQGSAEDVLVVYDPSLGFTTGGGWFYWPGTSDRTNFGYTMKYNKKGGNTQGNLLLIRHMSDGTIFRLKSNTLEGLALGQDTSIPMGWASFSGKGTYLESGWPEPIGNYEFTAYVEDRNEPGTGVDRFWIEVRDKDRIIEPDLSLPRPAVPNGEPIQGGNIVVPHQAR